MPIITQNRTMYNQNLSGYFGEFGKGGGAQIFFIQTAISPAELDKISLVSDIEGSEKWEVRDLFQRDVDLDRVKSGLVPYLLDPNAIKFFNPLTLTFIPSDSSHDSFAGEIPSMPAQSKTIDEYEYECIENEGLFQYRYINRHHENGVVEWNDTKAKLVAIDGQHRLSALKNVLADPERRRHIDFDNWSIPVVVFGVRSVDQEQTRDQRTLDIIRRTFVYINTEAREPTPTRQILLNDSKVNEICTQEFVNFFHSNDCSEDRDPSRLPLLIFNWRGAESNSRTDHTPGTIKTVAEIRDWFEHYILGENWSPEQQGMLGIEVTGDTMELKRAFQSKSLKPASVKSLRGLFNRQVLPGVAYFLQEFTPYKRYGAEVRAIETRFTKASTEARHAFHKFRFGGSRAHSTLTDSVAHIELEIGEQIEGAKGQYIPDLLQKDIGMRGVMFAYGDGWKTLKQSEQIVDFTDYSEWFTSALNEMYADGWFGPFRGPNKNTMAAAKLKFLRQVAYSHNNEIINYRIGDSRSALGCLLTLVLLRKAFNKEFLSDNDFSIHYNKLRDRLSATLLNGYKKQVRPAIVESLPSDSLPKAINAEVKKEGEKLTNTHLKQLDVFLKVRDL